MTTNEEETPGPDGPTESGDDEELHRRLDALREKISSTDRELVRLIGERRALVLEVGRIKEALGLQVLDPAREAEVVRKVARLARELGVDEEMTRDVVWRIIASAREAQEGRARGWPDRTEPPEPER
jgi:chorismate mutase